MSIIFIILIFSNSKFILKLYFLNDFLAGPEGSGRKTSKRRLNAIRSRTRAFVPTIVLRKGSELAWDKLAKKFSAPQSLV
jgi:hypothetical protein